MVFLSVYLLTYPIIQWVVGGWLLAPAKKDEAPPAAAEGNGTQNGEITPALVEGGANSGNGALGKLPTVTSQVWCDATHMLLLPVTGVARCDARCDVAIMIRGYVGPLPCDRLTYGLWRNVRCAACCFPLAGGSPYSHLASLAPLTAAPRPYHDRIATLSRPFPDRSPTVPRQVEMSMYESESDKQAAAKPSQGSGTEPPYQANVRERSLTAEMPPLRKWSGASPQGLLGVTAPTHRLGRGVAQSAKLPIISRP